MSPRSRLVVALVSTALIAYIAVGSLLGRVLGDTSYGQLSIFNEVVRLVLDSYVEPVNLDRAMAGARLGMSDALDGDSAYLDPEEFKLYQQPSKEADAEVGLAADAPLRVRDGRLAAAGLARGEGRPATGRHREDDRREAHAADARGRWPSGCCAARPARP